MFLGECRHLVTFFLDYSGEKGRGGLHEGCLGEGEEMASLAPGPEQPSTAVSLWSLRTKMR